MLFGPDLGKMNTFMRNLRIQAQNSKMHRMYITQKNVIRRNITHMNANEY